MRDSHDGLIDLVATVDVGAEVRLRFGTVAVLSAEWGEREGGRSLVVVPTAWARSGGQAAADGGWEQLVGRLPDAATAGMEAQFRCHAFGAPDKASWNLEPWRPEVGYEEMVASRCNPGGTEEPF